MEPAQFEAIRNLEESLAHGRPRALIQMATGSGKTFTAANIAYRLIKYGGARRMVLTNPPFGRKSSVTIVGENGESRRDDLTVVRDDF